MLAVSILKNKIGTENAIKEINKTSADFLHVDVLDKTYVDEVFNPLKEVEASTKPLNIHIMAEHQWFFVYKYSKLNPESIILQYELCEDVGFLLNHLRFRGIKCGLAIEPNTKISDIVKYIPLLDYVLILGVNPGKGGQELQRKVLYKFDILKRLKEEEGYGFKTIIDGGINDKTINDVKADIFVCGSFITMSDNYQKQIEKLGL